ncbi:MULTISPECIES: class I SAM-dependent methyltransferase [Aerococcus]|uniref:Methyltransferase domain-containing protein n=1 Tax=Aerococcus sanguinicola TaxID=119206 RepID=A0A5N1GMB3_9LACT|nr:MULTISPECIES: class I SAM-dependent methyltransferase [Aerococcus]KAA9302113.1 methyltransferase domain-containing protein [Aerococcus sanguinicola]MDK6368458.1 class I SAM-dependent methyltransferase [Aerococcus sp. UMB9870]MDK6679541.1 class I SAM-dependent methyltransferase [Aerococcus sp. UMB8608]MDK6686385.1 class I SAM-dependent methyltransferase [Aerococcus sp. UMB8623]MDK6940993.1 class I SAM-dependent methyltransferase [Aerococcus sp. UMB8487]
MHNIIQIYHHIIEEALRPGMTALDGTAGTGQDTAFLARLVGPQGRVYAFDIQKQAIQRSQDRLNKEALAQQVTLIQADHAQLDQHLPDDLEIDLACFNLGYLPGADKAIITQGQSTCQAIDSCCQYLKAGAKILVAAYLGHPGGMEEYETVCQHLAQYPQESYNISQVQFLNQRNLPPRLIVIEKRGGDQHENH